MQQSQTRIFTGHYSEIEGYQKSRTVTYGAEQTPKGIRLSVEEKCGSDIRKEECVCPSDSFEHLTAFLKYICENSIGVGGWYDILQDRGIQFQVL